MRFEETSLSFSVNSLMKIPGEIWSALASVALVAIALFLAFHLPGDISGVVLPKRDAHKIKEIFLHGEFETKLPDGTAAVDKRFRVPTTIVTLSQEVVQKADHAQMTEFPEQNSHKNIDDVPNHTVEPITQHFELSQSASRDQIER